MQGSECFGGESAVIWGFARWFLFRFEVGVVYWWLVDVGFFYFFRGE